MVRHLVPADRDTPPSSRYGDPHSVFGAQFDGTEEDLKSRSIRFIADESIGECMCGSVHSARRSNAKMCQTWASAILHEGEGPGLDYRYPRH
jgi:hypothetical protein